MTRILTQIRRKTYAPTIAIVPNTQVFRCDSVTADTQGLVETTEYHNNIGQSVDIVCYASE